MKDPTKAKWWRDLELDKCFTGSASEPFIELAVLASMVAAAADGSASAEEYDHVVTMIDLATKGAADRDHVDSLVQRAIEHIERADIDGLMNEVKERVPDNATATAAFAFAIACAFSDGNVGEDELATLDDLARILGVSRARELLKTVTS